ncbi:MAG: DUF2807 domain-containing protein [Gemmataceae bacterium]|nr:DUF2807 domain-containing protein [Gemmataceae bacterium]
MGRMFVLLAVPAISLLAGCGIFIVSGPTITGSGVAAKEVRPVSNVRTVFARNIGNVKITVGDKESLTVTGDANIVPLTVSTVDNGTLTVGLQDNTAVSTKVPLEFTLTVKSLDAVKVSGAPTVSIQDLDAPKFDVNLSGAGSVKVSGKSESLSLSLTGAGTVDAAGCEAQAVSITTTGAGRISVHAVKTLDVTATGASVIDYLGSPTVKKSLTGASVISPRK